MFHLFVCSEITTVSGLVVTFIADVLCCVRIMSLQVAFKRRFCVACEFTLVTLEILFIQVPRHMGFHVRFAGGATYFVVTLVALEYMPYVVIFCQVSFQRKRYFRFVRTHCANYFTALVNSLVHDKFVFFQVL